MDFHNILQNKSPEEVKQIFENIHLDNFQQFVEDLQLLSPVQQLEQIRFLAAILRYKIYENAEYVDLLLSPVDLAKYAAVSMLMGLPVYKMALPDFIVYLHNQGIDRQKLSDYALWAESLGLVKYADLKRLPAAPRRAQDYVGPREEKFHTIQHMGVHMDRGRGRDWGRGRGRGQPFPVRRFRNITKLEKMDLISDKTPMMYAKNSSNK